MRALPEVEAAAGTILDLSGDANQAKLLDKRRQGHRSGNNPTFGLGVDPRTSGSTRSSSSRARWASGPRPGRARQNTADEQGFAVGDRVQVAADGPRPDVHAHRHREVRRRRARSAARRSRSSTSTTAQRCCTKRRLRRDLGRGEGRRLARRRCSTRSPRSCRRPRDVRTGAEQAQEDGKGVGEFVKYIRYFLLAFGGIALFVGGFVIFNTLSITVAQRTRELATLRTLGASRRQVLRSVVLEAACIGARSPRWSGCVSACRARDGAGGAVRGARPRPAADRAWSFAPRTVVVSLLVGHARDAGREASSRRSGRRASRRSRRSARAACVAKKLSRKTLVVVADPDAARPPRLLVYGMLGSGLGAARADHRDRGSACSALFIGVAAIAPRLVRPLAARRRRARSRAIGGVAGRLARENADAQPGPHRRRPRQR